MESATSPAGGMWAVMEGAGSRRPPAADRTSGAAYCLHLHHHSTGEVREAAFRKHQVNTLFKGPTDEFLDGLESFTGYGVRRRAQTSVPTRLGKEFERLADRHDKGGLIGRPDHQLADGLHNLAGHH